MIINTGAATSSASIINVLVLSMAQKIISIVTVLYTKYYSDFIIYGNTTAYGLIYLGNGYNEQNTYRLLPKKRIIIHVMRNKIYVNNEIYGLLDLER
jgi:hypothetical protein